jgi:hypothetical protein
VHCFSQRADSFFQAATMRNNFLILIAVVAVFVGYRFLGSNGSGVTSSFPKQFIADRTNFTQSIADLGEASDLTQPPSNNSGEGFKIPKATEQRIYSKIEEGIALSKKVSDAFLDYIHPI